MADEVIVPKFSKKQQVRLSLYNGQGKPKNEMAKKVLPRFAETAEVVSVGLYEDGKKTTLVYRVRVEDGTVLQLTEDCLMPVRERS